MPDQIDAQDPADLRQQASLAMGRRDFEAARKIHNQLVEIAPDQIVNWLTLAVACNACGDTQAAHRAIEGGLTLEPRDFILLLMRARLLEQAGDPKAGHHYAIALAQAPDEGLLDSPTRSAIAHGREVHQAHLARLRHHILERVETTGKIDNKGLESRIDRFIDHMLHVRTPYAQSPSDFHYPGLPAIEFYDHELFGWLEPLEARFPLILEELRNLISIGDNGSEPYVDYDPHLPVDQWRDLNHNSAWSAFHLFKHGVPVVENTARCPETVAALSLVDQPVIQGCGPNAMFSVLRPGTRIPPHSGVSNTRLVCHLPLIIPDNCGFRVGHETRAWVPGKAWVFDDTIDHEAWNLSDQVRIIFMFDIWSPFIPPKDRPAIVAAMESLGQYGQTRNDHSL